MSTNDSIQLSELIFGDGSAIEMLSPLTEENLKRVTPLTREIHFGTEFSEEDYERIAKTFDIAPNAVLKYWGIGGNLDFLRNFPNVRRLNLGLWYDSLEPLNLISNLVDLKISPEPVKGFSLESLKHFSNLQRLSIVGSWEGGIKEIPEFKNSFSAVAQIPNLEVLFLHSVKLPGLDIFAKMPKLRSLTIVQSLIKELSGIGLAEGLLHLHLGYLLNKNVDFMHSAKSLQYLSLDHLSGIEILPSLERLSNLRRVVLTSMKRLTNLSSIAQAPNLEDLVLDEEKYLKASDLECFAGHPSLKHVWTNMGSVRKDKAVGELLGLPRLGARSRFEFKFESQ